MNCVDKQYPSNSRINQGINFRGSLCISSPIAKSVKPVIRATIATIAVEIYKDKDG